jgi:hypothetical protein
MNIVTAKFRCWFCGVEYEYQRETRLPVPVFMRCEGCCEAHRRQHGDLRLSEIQEIMRCPDRVAAFWRVIEARKKPEAAAQEQSEPEAMV